MLHVTKSESVEKVDNVYARRRFSDIEEELEKMTKKEVILKAQQGYYKDIVGKELEELKYEDVRKILGKLKVIEKESIKKVGEILEETGGFNADVVIIDSYYGVEDEENEDLLELVKNNKEIEFVIVRHVPTYVEDSLIQGEEFEYSHSKELIEEAGRVITLAQEGGMRLRNEVYVFEDNKKEVSKIKYEIDYKKVMFEVIR